MPEPFLVEIAIAPKSNVDTPALLVALDCLATDGQTIGVRHDPRSGEIIVEGRSEAELDHAIHMLAQKAGIAIVPGAPQVAYRETLTRRVEKDFTYKTKIGGGQFARVKINFEPNAEHAAFASRIAGGALPAAYISGVAAGIAAVMGAGILAGFPVIDVMATLIDGAFHETESSADIFETAARAAFREALREGGSILLEPIMAFEVATPEDYLGFVTGDITARRGQIRSVETRVENVVVCALVPLSNTFGYVNQLRSGTRGCGTSTMRFDHYAPAAPRPDDEGPAAPAIALRA